MTGKKKFPNVFGDNFGGGIYDVYGWFRRILGPPDPNLGHLSPSVRPLGAVSGKFSGDLKVARGVSATNEPKKSGS